MKKAKVKIARLPGFEDSPEEAEGWRLEHVGGLVAHRRWRKEKGSPWKQAGDWIVTHEASGMRVDGHPPNSVYAGGFPKRADAFAFMEIADLLADWTLPAGDLVARDDLKVQVRAIREEVIDGLKVQ